jgi:hypothetical protein
VSHRERVPKASARAKFAGKRGAPRHIDAPMEASPRRASSAHLLRHRRAAHTRVRPRLLRTRSVALARRSMLSPMYLEGVPGPREYPAITSK